jgi:hypothetical protein
MHDCSVRINTGCGSLPVMDSKYSELGAKWLRYE